MLNELGFPQGAPLALMPLLINLAIGAALSLVLRWHFKQFGSTLSNREEFAQETGKLEKYFSANPGAGD